MGKTIAWGGPTVGFLIPNLGSNVLCHPVLGKGAEGTPVQGLGLGFWLISSLVQVEVPSSSQIKGC